MRTENFTIKDDGNFDFHCNGDLELTASDYIQNEEFSVCRNLVFLYSNTETNPTEEYDEVQDDDEDEGESH